jgi:hypothetical protein
MIINRLKGLWEYVKKKTLTEIIKGTKKWGKHEKEKKEKTDKSRSKRIKKEKYN